MGGARWDPWRKGCHPGRRRSKAQPPATTPSSGAPAADVTPSAATGAAVEPLRALWRMEKEPPGGPAPGVAGDRGGDLAGAAPNEAQRRERARRSVRQAGLVHAPREGDETAIPGHGRTAVVKAGRRRHPPGPRPRGTCPRPYDRPPQTHGLAVATTDRHSYHCLTD